MATHTRTSRLTPIKDQAARVRKTDRHLPSQLSLWTLRTLLHTGAYRRYVEAQRGIDDEVLRDVGLAVLIDEKLDATTAQRHLKARLHDLKQSGVSRDAPLFQNVGRLGDLFGLTPVEREVLAYAVATKVHGPLDDVLDHGRRSARHRLMPVLAAILDLDEASVREALAQEGTLCSTRLLHFESCHPMRHGVSLAVMDCLETLLSRDHVTAETMTKQFFTRSPPATLKLDDFPHLARDLAIVVGLLAAARAQGTRGVNVLLYGEPGTGKTELARALAAALSAVLYEVNVEDSDGDALGGDARLTAFALTQRLLVRSAGALVLFDEVEDAFPRHRHSFFGVQVDSGQKKGWTNRLLEGNAAPAIWICNEVDQIDPAFMRRFSFVMQLRTPPAPVRRRLLESCTAGLPLRPPCLQRLAGDERLTPAHIQRAATVVRSLALQQPEAVEEAFGRILENSLAVQDGPSKALSRPAEPLRYDLTLLNTDCDLPRLVHGLGARPRGTVCLYGPPGTGKTAFVRHLAEALGRPLIVQKGSDLLGCYVGQTEANIAAMFRRARDEQSVLFLDEADSFLQDRSRAHRSWEVTQVNELLVQIESFDGLFVCATNRMEDLDDASLRRFMVKVRFDPPTADQRWRLFLAALVELGGDVPAGDEERGLRREVDHLDRLTPGDVAAVLRQATLLGGAMDAQELLAALTREHGAKRGAGRQRVGF